MPVEIDYKKLSLSLQPHVLVSLMKLDDDSEMSFTELERIIKSDQNMAGFVLKIANSPLYSRGKEIRNLQHAISLLGFRVIRSLASAATSQELFKGGNYARFRRYVWQHSVAVAVIAMRLAEKMSDQSMKEETFVAGLLHDLGKVILNSVDRKMFIEVINLVEKNGLDFPEAERKIFGINHMEVGERVAKEWKLPGIYQLIMGHHHFPDDLDLSTITDADLTLFDIIVISNEIAVDGGFGIGLPENRDSLKNSYSRLGFSNEEKAKMTAKVKALVENDEFYKYFITLL